MVKCNYFFIVNNLLYGVRWQTNIEKQKEKGREKEKKREKKKD